MGGPKIAFYIGPIGIAWYGIILVAATLAGTTVAAYEAKRRGDNPDHVWNGVLLALAFGMIGARLYHVLSAWDYYSRNPLQIFNTRTGGLGIFGALAGGLLALWIYTRRNNLSFFHWADIAAPGVALAQVIGRWGNFVNQELYGYPTNVPWAIYIDPAHRLPGFESYERFHPTFLYESLWSLGNFLFLMFVARRFKERLLDGDVFLLYFINYGVGRFLVEFQRPDAWRIGGIATAQIVGLVAAAACSVVLWHRHRALPHRTTEHEGPSL
ncbi:MAG: prolipoprotein diacylglyceryl transferase [Chloroflexi bacterium]|nr:prolipoprotein diacylglyceryl transferase [Chloroflexota bacterium]